MSVVTLTYYAAARAAAGGITQESFHASTLSDALAQAANQHGADMDKVLNISSLLREGTYVDKDTFNSTLTGDVALDVLPPFAGG